MCTHFHSDPFVNTTNVITPLSVDLSSIDEYSVKLSVSNCANVHKQINVYSGKFVDTINIASDGFQNTLLKTLEVALQKYISSSYLLPEVATIVDPPSAYVPVVNDIVVSFAGYNDYLVFKSGSVINLISNNILTTVTIGTPVTTPNGTYTVNSYNSVLGDFNVTVTRSAVVKVLNFSTSTTTYTYDSLVLEEDTLTDLSSNITKTYRVPYFTDIGITRFTSTLPSPLVYVKGSKGYIYQEGYTITAANLLSFIVSGNTFTSIQLNMVTKIIYAVFSGFKTSLMHVMKTDGVDLFSTNRGFSTFITIHGISIEIKLS